MFLVSAVCQLLCAEAVGATPSKVFLVYKFYRKIEQLCTASAAPRPLRSKQVPWTSFSRSRWWSIFSAQNLRRQWRKKRRVCGARVAGEGVRDVSASRRRREKSLAL